MLINHIIDFMICDGDTGQCARIAVSHRIKISFCPLTLEYRSPVQVYSCGSYSAWIEAKWLLIKARDSNLVFLASMWFLPTTMLCSACNSKHYCYCNSYNNSFTFATGNAYQLSQLIRTLLDPENMALGANVSPVCKASIIYLLVALNT